MSLMDLFTSQGEVGPSSDSSGGDWKDWFLDMKGRRPFGRTIRPDSGSKKGDWMDWFLNREGPAGRFRGSRRPRYGANYLFNDGGSVQSGPRTRQKLQPRPGDYIKKGPWRPPEGPINPNDYIRKGPWRPPEGPINPNDYREPYNLPPYSAKPDYDFGPPRAEPWPYDPNRKWPDPMPLGQGNMGAPMRQDNRGVMGAMANNPMVQKAKNIYNKIDPWIPDLDVGGNNLGYSFEKPLLGGTLGFGMDYGWDDEDIGAFINWKTGLGA